ncbi:DUF6084 family protein [Streptomyces sannanensis]|uniref:DUF6084 family protein n=1 Tax=Streptomyces sannanensis TaxID=285536 RepID=A0ABP6SLW0_9ACTN
MTVPELAFTVTAVRPARLTAVPTLEFGLAVTREGGGPVRSVLLTTLIRIAPARRRYDHVHRLRLAELFGTPDRWAETLRPLVWTRLTTVVPPFDDRTEVTLAVPCTTDIQLAVAKYFRAVDHGEVPLDFLFSGTVFHSAPGSGLNTAQISWDSHTDFDLPAALWREATGRTGWIPLSADSYDRLDDFRARHTLSSWDETANALLDRAGADITGAPWTP